MLATDETFLQLESYAWFTIRRDCSCYYRFLALSQERVVVYKLVVFDSGCYTILSWVLTHVASVIRGSLPYVLLQTLPLPSYHENDTQRNQERHGACYSSARVSTSGW